MFGIPMQEAAPPPATPTYYDSGLFAAAAAGSYAHGLGVKPSRVVMSIVNVLAIDGYVPGDEIFVLDPTNLSCWANASVVGYSNIPGTALNIPHKTSGAYNLRSGYFNLRIQAWA